MLIDANLLIYAHNTAAPQHRAAAAWLDEQLRGERRVGLPWQSLTAFLRLVTNPRLFRRALDGPAAWAVLEHGLELASADTDFARFPEVRWVNPLA